ncbi:MAG: OsmC family protein [Actinomycetota bacterium]|nr:OsmC family protein [Actinomycetota bacterium]
MHNVNTDALEATIAKAQENPAAVRQDVALDGEWQTQAGQPQFQATIPYPNGELTFQADFPAPMGGSGAAPNPLAYCFWGGLACYAMTFAQEAARQGVEVRQLHARMSTRVDQTRMLGLSDQPPVEHIDWHLEVDADAAPEQLEELKRLADERCPGVWCTRNPVSLDTHLEGVS